MEDPYASKKVWSGCLNLSSEDGDACLNGGESGSLPESSDSNNMDVTPKPSNVSFYDFLGALTSFG